CCVRHDAAYWRGGTREERAAADDTLRECIAATGDSRLAPWMERVVHVSAAPYLPTPFRWSYGWPYTRGYRALPPSDRARAQQLPAEFACAARGEHAEDSAWLRSESLRCPNPAAMR